MAMKNRSIKRQYEVIATMERAFPAGDITDLYMEALELARAGKSWKGVLAVAEAINDRLVGKSVQMIQRSTTSLGELLMEAREVAAQLEDERARLGVVEAREVEVVDAGSVIEGNLGRALDAIAVES